MHDRSGVTGSAPDGDSSYIQVTIPAKDLYTLQPAAICSGRILTVAVTLVAKAISGSLHARVIVRPDPTNSLTQAIGLDNALGENYEIFHGYSDTSPRTITFWS